MSTLQEIEKAVSNLTLKELDHLETMLRVLRQQGLAGSRQSPGKLADFSGVLKLSEDPLAWQNELRREWE